MGCARLLVDKGANVNLYFKFGRGFSTPMLSMLQPNNVTGVQFLLENGARVNPFENIPGAVESLNLNDANKAEERLTILKLLIDAGADVNASVVGRPLLSRLEHSKEGHAELALVLLENGAKGYGLKELLLAAIQGHIGLLDWLLDHGIDPLGADEYLNTPLHFAAVHDHLELAKRLVSTDTLAALNAYGETPLDMAGGETSDLLESHDAPDGHGVSFWEAIRNGDLDRVKAYEKSGMDLRVSEPQAEGNDQNLSPLMQAVHSKQSDIVKYLIEHHDNIFAETNLMKEVRLKRLSEIEKILNTKFRLSYRLQGDRTSGQQLSISYAGFDVSAPYHLESSTDLKNWMKIEGTEHRFKDRPENAYDLDIPQFTESRQFIRLRKAE
jgi:ankyrin repeat protein